MIAKEILTEVIVSQREFWEKADLGTPREKEKDILVEAGLALLITGIRRCGKSTFLHQLFQKHKKGYYLNLEDPRLDGFELSDFNRIEAILPELYGGAGTYFFDEIQIIDQWEKFIRYLVDKKEKVVITGSNASLLSPELGTKLTGRHLPLELFPFSYPEFLAIKKATPNLKSFEKYLDQGGFPEFLKKENQAIHHQLLSDVIMKDIAARSGIKNISSLHKIAIYLLSNVGKEFSYNSIRKMLEIKSVQSVIDYVYYLENAYLIFTIPKFSYSYKQQVVNPKKAYSIDNGFSSSNSASFSKDKGKMLENCVFLQLRRKWKKIFYFREDNECDFIIKEKEAVIQALQVCFDFTAENKGREIKGLLCALQQFNLARGLILTYNQEDELIIEGRKVILQPVWKWLLNRA